MFSWRENLLLHLQDHYTFAAGLMSALHGEKSQYLEKINNANHCIQTDHHRNKPEDSYDSCLVRFSGIKMFEKRTHVFSITSVSRKISSSQDTNLYAVKNIPKTPQQCQLSL